VDVVELMMGQSKRASDIAMAESMKLVSAPESVIAHVVALRAEEVVAPAAGEVVAPVAAAEPEVIKKGKKEEEAEAPVEAKGKKK
jgi:large subunit ribosomal protein L25